MSDSVTRLPFGERQIVDDRGYPVERSIPTIDVAREVMRRLEDAEEPIARRHARYQAQVNRNPPNDPDKLRELNLGYKTNLNFGEAASIINQRAGQHFELFNEVPTLVDFQSVKFLDDKGVQPRIRWEDIVAEEFTTTIKEWSGFLPLMDFMRREADTNDVGVCAWRDQYDWRPVPIHRGAFFPSPYAKVEVEAWDLCALADTYSPHDLLRVTSDEQAAKEEGWDTEQVRRILVELFIGAISQDTKEGVDSGYATVSRWETLQNMIRNNDPTCMAKMFEPVKVRHIFVKEPESAKISHLIFSTAVCSEGDGFMCQLLDKYDNMAQAVGILPSNYGNGYIRGIRGLMADIEAHCDVSNRFMCDILDAGKLSGTLMLKNLTGNSDPRRVQLIRAGVLTLLPPGTEALQASSFAPPINNLVMVRDLSSAIMRNNTGVSRTGNESWLENQAQKTAREVAEISSKEARLDKSNVAFDYAQIQKLYREMYRRMVSSSIQGDKTLQGAPEAIQFVKRCIERGVPKALLKEGGLRLHIVQTIGFGSWGVRLDVTNQLVSMRNLFDEAGRKNAVRDRIAALVGQRNVDRYLASSTRDDIPSNETSIATLENSDMQQGQATVVGEDQAHLTHLVVHVAPLQQILQTVAEKGVEAIDPEKALGALGQFIPHVSDHLQLFGADPAMAQYVQQFEEILKAALLVRDQLNKQYEKMMAEQQQQQEQQQQMLAEAQGMMQSREHEVELAKAQGLLQIKSDMNRSLMDMRQARQAHNEQMANAKFSVDTNLRSQKQAVDISLEQQLANAKIEIERLKASAKAGR